MQSDPIYCGMGTGALASRIRGAIIDNIVNFLIKEMAKVYNTKAATNFFEKHLHKLLYILLLYIHILYG